MEQVRVRDLLSKDSAQELEDLNHALQRSNHIATQLKTSLSLVLEREELLALEKDSLQQELTSLKSQFQDLKRSSDSHQHQKELIQHKFTNFEGELIIEKQKNRELSELLKNTENELNELKNKHKLAEKRVEDLENALKRSSSEYQNTISKLRDQLVESVHASKDQLHAIERKLQVIHSDRSRASMEKDKLLSELSRVSEESNRKSEERQRVVDRYERKVKELEEELGVVRSCKENATMSLTELLDRHEELEREYQDAVFRAEELSAQLKASQLSTRHLEESLDHQNTRLRHVLTENTLHYEDFPLSDSQKRQLLSQTLENERLNERAFFQKAIEAILAVWDGKYREISEKLREIPVEDAETLLKFIAKIPSLIENSERDARVMRVLAKVTDSSIDVIDQKVLVFGQKSYEFDRIFGENDKIEQVYEEISVLLEGLAKGRSSSVYIFSFNAFMFNNMVHRTLLALFKSITEVVMYVTEGGEEPSYEQKVTTYAAASKIMEAVAKRWRQPQQHIVLSLKYLESVLNFVSVNAGDGEVAEELANSLAGGEESSMLPQHLKVTLSPFSSRVCILTLDSESTALPLLQLSQVLTQSFLVT